jgi:uncharacterized membrane protein
VSFAVSTGAYAFAAIGVVLATAGLVVLVRGRTLAPELTRTTNVTTPARARAVGALWIAIGVAFVVLALRS